MNYQKPKAKRGDSKKTRRQVTKVSKNEFFILKLEREVKTTQGWATRLMRWAKIIFFYTYI